MSPQEQTLWDAEWEPLEPAQARALDQPSLPEVQEEGLWAGGSLKQSAPITSEAVFRLPSGFTESDWECQLSGTMDIDDVALAESADEI